MSVPASIAIALCAAGVIVALVAAIAPAWAAEATGMVSCLALMVWGLWFIDKQRDGK